MLPMDQHYQNQTLFFNTDLCQSWPWLHLETHSNHELGLLDIGSRKKDEIFFSSSYLQRATTRSLKTKMFCNQ